MAKCESPLSNCTTLPSRKVFNGGDDVIESIDRNAKRAARERRGAVWVRGEIGDGRQEELVCGADCQLTFHASSWKRILFLDGYAGNFDSFTYLFHSTEKLEN